METSETFESRKRDHIQLALENRNQTVHLAQFDRVTLQHEACPDFNFEQVDISTNSLNQTFSSPFFISSMTAGHKDALELNLSLALACQEKKWPMGVGSQRRQLFDKSAAQEWTQIRSKAPQTQFFGNIGIAQLIETPLEKIKILKDSLQAAAMIVHLNPLQECLQPEGTTNFSGAYKVIETLSREMPVIVKETGCGMSLPTMKRLKECGVSVIDVSGTGGTHWGRIEGRRSQEDSELAQMAQTFENWGYSTVQSLIWAQELGQGVEVWASGGLRNGLESAKCLGLGAKMVGFAKPALENALKGQDALVSWMTRIERELKIALFCTGSKNIEGLKGKVAINGL